MTVPTQDQRVEYLIDSILNCADSTLQAAIGLVRANTNNMRNNFEAAATAMIRVDPYQRSQRGTSTKGATVSAIDFSGGRGSTGVDLRWHHKKEFMSLPAEQRDELSTWIKTNEGQQAIDRSRRAMQKTNKRKGGKGDSNGASMLTFLRL